MDTASGLISFAGFVMGIILLVVFFYMASNIARIRRVAEKYNMMFMQPQKFMYKCKHCGYGSNDDAEYCPKCGKNSEGKTKS